MKKTTLVGSVIVVGVSLFMLGGCKKSPHPLGGAHDEWSWPYYQYDEHGNPVIKYDDHGNPIYMKPKGSVAPYPFPKEADESEHKVYGVAQSEWDHMTPGQQSIIKEEYMKREQAKQAKQSATKDATKE